MPTPSPSGCVRLLAVLALSVGIPCIAAGAWATAHKTLHVPKSAHPSVAKYSSSDRPRSAVSHADGAQVHFVPENFNAVVGGDNFQPGSNATADGIPATQAKLTSPNGLAFDDDGNLYVSDDGSALVRKVSAADGTIRTVAGGGSLRGVTGPGTSAQLTSPDALTAGPGGVLYIADSIDDVIYRLSAGGTLSVIAGILQSPGYSTDGTLATSAHINEPEGLAVDSTGLLYFSEKQNHVVRRINADGTLTTVAGSHAAGGMYAGDNGAATAASLWYPWGIAFQPNGDLLIADSANLRVRSVSATSGIITTVAGEGIDSSGPCGSGAATSADVSPRNLATDAAGQIYFKSHAFLCRVGTDGNITQIAGYFNEFGAGIYGYGKSALQTSLNEQTQNPVAIGPDGSAYTVSSAQGFDDGSISVVGKIGPDTILDFGSVQIHDSQLLTLSVENTGSAALTFGSQFLSVTGSAFSAVPGRCVTSLAPGATCLLTVGFSPVQAGAATETLTLKDSAGTQTVTLRGYGDLPASATSLTIQPASVTAGSSVVLTATVQDANTQLPVTSGTVTFYDDNTGNMLASAQLSGSGTATATVTPATGTYQVSAQFAGNSSYAESGSDEVSLTVNAVPATVTLTASASTATTGSTIVLTATVSVQSGTASGTIAFLVDNTVVATVPITNGSATVSIAAPPPGKHTLVAYYGNANSYSNTLPLTTHGALLQFVSGAATTVAGTPADANHGGFSGDGGPATSARLHTPAGIVADAGGTLYIADEQNNVIRKVAADGTITTYAGRPYTGSYYSTYFSGDGGLATNAYMTNPAAVALDTANNLYIADYSNGAVRRIDAATGIITTFAGVGGNLGYNQDSGTAISTRLNRPAALAFDSAGNLYIADSGNNLVRKVDTSGNLTTVAGRYGYSGNPVEGGQATQQVLHQPMGVAVDAAGNVYISDTQTTVVRKVDLTGAMYKFAGGGSSYVTDQGDGGPATAAALVTPQQMAFDAAGNLYIADTGGNNVRKVDPSGVISTVAGSRTSQARSSYYDPAGASATVVPLAGPSGVGVAPDGSLLVTDNYDQTVWRVGPAGVVQFGPQDAGTTSDAQTITLFSAGDLPVTFAANPYTVSGDYLVSAGGPAPCDFSQQLAAGASCTLTVQYKPQTGVLRGSIVFAGNALGSPTINLITNNNVVSTTVQLYLSATAINFGDTLLIYAAVAPATNGPTPSGTIRFYNGATLLGSTTLSAGSGYIYTTTLPVGTHSLTAVYNGDGYNGRSTSDPMAMTVYVPTQTSLTASSSSVSAGTSVKLSAMVASGGAAVSSGTVTFFDGNSPIDTVAVNASGVATLTTSALSPGNHNFTATFNAQGSYGSSTSPGVAVTATTSGNGTQGLDYVLNLSPEPIVLHRGETKTIAVTATLTDASYQGTVQLACGTLPSYVTCSFSPATIFFAGAIQSLNSTLTLTSSAGPNGHAIRIDPKRLVSTRP